MCCVSSSLKLSLRLPQKPRRIRVRIGAGFSVSVFLGRFLDSLRCNPVLRVVTSFNSYCVCRRNPAGFKCKPIALEFWHSEVFLTGLFEVARTFLRRNCVLRAFTSLHSHRLRPINHAGFQGAFSVFFTISSRFSRFPFGVTACCVPSPP